MGAVHVLDNYYLSITLLVTIVYQLFFFSIAFSFKFDKLTDFAGGTNFILLAIITLAFSGGRNNAHNVVASLFIIIWGARLSGFLLFRILKTGKDSRFDDRRDKFFPFLGFWVLVLTCHCVEFPKCRPVQPTQFWYRKRYRWCHFVRDWSHHGEYLRHTKIPLQGPTWK